MGEMKRAQELRVDEVSVQKLRENQLLSATKPDLTRTTVLGRFMPYAVNTRFVE